MRRCVNSLCTLLNAPQSACMPYVSHLLHTLLWPLRIQLCVAVCDSGPQDVVHEHTDAGGVLHGRSARHLFTTAAMPVCCHGMPHVVVPLTSTCACSGIPHV